MRATVFLTATVRDRIARRTPPVVSKAGSQLAIGGVQLPILADQAPARPGPARPGPARLGPRSEDPRGPARPTEHETKSGTARPGPARIVLEIGPRFGGESAQAGPRSDSLRLAPSLLRFPGSAGRRVPRDPRARCPADRPAARRPTRKKSV